MCNLIALSAAASGLERLGRWQAGSIGLSDGLVLFLQGVGTCPRKCFLTTLRQDVLQMCFAGSPLSNIQQSPTPVTAASRPIRFGPYEGTLRPYRSAAGDWGRTHWCFMARCTDLGVNHHSFPTGPSQPSIFILPADRLVEPGPVRH